MKKIMILGAGVYQVPLIQQAKSMGLYTIVVSIPGNYPGFFIADKIYKINTTDVEAICCAAQQEQIDGILTTGTDVAVITIGTVCERLGLTGISRHSAELTTDKAKMKSALVQGGVRTAPFFAVHNLEEAKSAIRTLGAPVMFKCVDKSGSRGIIRVDSEADAEEALSYARACSDADYIVVERFLTGCEIGIDGYVCGSHRVILPHAKIMRSNGMTKIPVGHIFPYECSNALYQDICRQTNKAIDALGLDHCFFNIDAMVDQDQCHLIEIGGRTGATCIPELAGIYLGCNFYEKMIQNALGENVEFPVPAGLACAGKLLCAEKTGVIQKIICPETGRIALDYSVGDAVRAFQVGPDRIGQLMVTGSDVQNALDNLSALEQSVQIDIV